MVRCEEQVVTFVASALPAFGRGVVVVVREYALGLPELFGHSFAEGTPNQALQTTADGRLS